MLNWTIVLGESSTKLNGKSNTQVEYLFKLYKLNFKPSTKYKNCMYLFYALKYFTFNYNRTIFVYR